ncbi:hypothetical protein NA63_2931 [Flavobacteriaceae bacterium MAR_2010_105]|nr:hypothetical protein NA63_2931 [Flavobacteriaceae bacterium MAR_2010_105]
MLNFGKKLKICQNLIASSINQFLKTKVNFAHVLKIRAIFALVSKTRVIFHYIYPRIDIKDV